MSVGKSRSATEDDRHVMSAVARNDFRAFAQLLTSTSSEVMEENNHEADSIISVKSVRPTPDSLSSKSQVLATYDVTSEIYTRTGCPSSDLDRHFAACGSRC